VEEHEKKVSLFDVFWRLLAMVAPLIAPHILGMERNEKIVIAGLWLAVMGPVFLMPSLNPRDWEDDARPFLIIFESIGRLFLGLIILSGVLFVLFGRGRY
jgi:hypothetical protein